jgi:hypothetical protein
MNPHVIYRSIMLVILLGYGYTCFCQTTNSERSKLSDSAEKLEKQSQKLADETKEISKQIVETSENVKQTMQNIKDLTSVFEPIFQLRIKKKSSQVFVNSSRVDSIKNQNSLTSQNISSTGKSQNADLFEPENLFYNIDGTANLGNQHNPKFGCYLDINLGRVLDEIDVAGNTADVDIIFTGTDYYNTPLYTLITPSYVNREGTSNYYFRGPLYKDWNIPVANWTEFSESEIGLTNLDGDKFNRISKKDQLIALVNQTTEFKKLFTSNSKLTGKVFALRVEMPDEKVYCLMHVIDHYGTTGTNAYLKIKLKISSQ